MHKIILSFPKNPVSLPLKSIIQHTRWTRHNLIQINSLSLVNNRFSMRKKRLWSGVIRKRVFFLLFIFISCYAFTDTPTAKFMHKYSPPRIWWQITTFRTKTYWHDIYFQHRTLSQTIINCRSLPDSLITTDEHNRHFFHASAATAALITIAIGEIWTCVQNNQLNIQCVTVSPRFFRYRNSLPGCKA